MRGQDIRYDGRPRIRPRRARPPWAGCCSSCGATGRGALARWVDATLWVAVGAMLVYGALGAYDDLQGLRDRQGVGGVAGSNSSGNGRGGLVAWRCTDAREPCVAPPATE